MIAVPAMGRISRISFLTDMTKSGALEIPLGFMLEGAWPDRARWLGLIGRTRLAPQELEKINLVNWPEFEKPFDLLDRLFEHGWEAAWGGAGAAVQGQWNSSALSISTDDASQLLQGLDIETEAAWVATSDMLCARLSVLGESLKPIQPPPAPRRFPRIALGAPSQSLPVPHTPKGRRMQEDFALAA